MKCASPVRLAGPLFRACLAYALFPLKIVVMFTLEGGLARYPRSWFLEASSR